MELAVRSIMTETVKIFGERNTATNALRQLIQMNSQSKLSPELWANFISVRKFLGDYGGWPPSEVAERYTDFVCEAIHP